MATIMDAGWVRYEDSTGWSIWYPQEWIVAFEGEGDLGLIADGGDTSAIFVVSIALNANPDNEGSLDYLVHDASLGQSEGLLEPFDSEDWFHIDLNWNGQQDPLDIYGFELRLARDPLSGDPFPEGSIAPNWWYGYYDPEARPAYGYILQIFGTYGLAYDVVDGIVLTFEPPGGVPGLNQPDQ